MINQPNTYSRLGTLLKWIAGGFIGWNLLRPEVRAEIKEFLSNEINTYNQRQVELERVRKLKELRDNLAAKSEMLSTNQPYNNAPIGKSSDKTVNPSDNSPAFRMSLTPLISAQPLNRDAAWQSKIIHPSIVLVLGKRGSGKSALGYRLLELLRYKADIYVVGVPEEARKLLPAWIGIVPSIEELPTNCIALVDEAYLSYHARDSMTAENKAVSQMLNLSRQREQTIIFISLDSGQIDKNIVSAANVIVFKELSMLQLEFGRPQLSKLAAQARQTIDSIQGSKKRWGFLYAPDRDSVGLMENELPSFWKPRLSHLFATRSVSTTKRSPKSMTRNDRQQRALELRALGASYGEIAHELGVSRGTAVNYIKGYPYQREKD